MVPNRADRSAAHQRLGYRAVGGALAVVVEAVEDRFDGVAVVRLHSRSVSAQLHEEFFSFSPWMSGGSVGAIVLGRCCTG